MANVSTMVFGQAPTHGHDPKLEAEYERVYGSFNFDPYYRHDYESKFRAMQRFFERVGCEKAYWLLNSKVREVLNDDGATVEFMADRYIKGDNGEVAWLIRGWVESFTFGCDFFVLDTTEAEPFKWLSTHLSDSWHE